MAEETEQGSGAVMDARRAADLIDALVRQIDAGEVEATSPERAYLVGAAASLRAMVVRPE